MKNMAALTVIILFLSMSFCFSENLTLLSIGAMPKGITASDGSQINSSILENLQDQNDLLNNIYIKNNVLEAWVNGKINSINSTNTNIIIKGKNKIIPKKIPAVSLKNISPALLKNINSYVKLDNILTVSLASAAAKNAPQTVTLNFVLQDGQGKKISSSSCVITMNRLKDSVFMNKTIKEALVSLYNLWARYYYIPKKTGSVILSVIPKNTDISIKSLDKKMNNGKNDQLPIGTYAMVLSLSNYNTLITNISINEKPLTYKITLQKISMKTNDTGVIKTGSIFIDADIPNAKFLIVEDGVSERIPYLATNLSIGQKTIIFDETMEYSYKKVNTEVKENNTVYEFTKLVKKGSGFKMACNIDGAYVIMNKEIAGIVSNGTFEYSGLAGLYGLTIMKDKYAAVRTNITLKSDSIENITISLQPKKIPGIIVTPQINGADVFRDNKKTGITPFYLYSEDTDNISLQIAATNLGFNNVSTNMPWRWTSENNILFYMNPLFGDIKITTLPDDAAVTIESAYRGKTTGGSLLVRDLPAKTIKVRIEKPGYKITSTNIYIAPNIENQYNFTLKEAPAKAFITSNPEKGFEVYVNGEYAGMSGESTIPMEFGKINIRLKKRGFKSIITNIEVNTKQTLDLNFTSTPGIGEDEFAENLLQQLNVINSLIENNDFDKAVSNTQSVLKTIEVSEYSDIDAVKDVQIKIEAKAKWLNEIGKIDDTIALGDGSVNRQDYDSALKNYEDAMSLIVQTGASESGYFAEKLKDLQAKIDTLKKKQSDQEQSSEAKKLLSKINPIIADGDSCSDRGEYAQAGEKYTEALKLIDVSNLKDNQTVKLSRERLEKKAKKAAELSKVRDDWWPKMTRNWDGASLDFLGGFISSSGVSFDSSKLNIPAYFRLGIHIIPFFGISLGGMYNFTYSSLKSSEQYALYAVTAGAILRIPVMAQLSLFGEYNFALSDFSTFNIMDKGIVNAGADIKFGFFGIKLFYELGYSSSFQKMYQGLGAGISFWFTEE